MKYFSLDVEALYPSIPVKEAIRYTMKFLKKWEREIDLYGINLDNIEEALEFVANNYFVQHNGRIYRQKEGVPMGAHYSPLLAIIYMNHIETQALEI